MIFFTFRPSDLFKTLRSYGQLLYLFYSGLELSVIIHNAVKSQNSLTYTNPGFPWL